MSKLPIKKASISSCDCYFKDAQVYLIKIDHKTIFLRKYILSNEHMNHIQNIFSAENAIKKSFISIQYFFKKNFSINKNVQKLILNMIQYRLKTLS